ncbi:MAG: hypothetical protein AAB575_01070 [Patescibacteria group bacterium]
MEQEKKSGARWKIIIGVSSVIAVGLALYFTVCKVSHGTAIAELKYELVYRSNIDFARRYVVDHDISHEELIGICREVRDQAVGNYGCERARELARICNLEYDELARKMDVVAVIERVHQLREDKNYYAAFTLANSCTPDYFSSGDLARELFDHYLRTDFVSAALNLANDSLYSSYISPDKYKRAQEALTVQLLSSDCEKRYQCGHVEGDYLDSHLRYCQSELAACKEKHIERSKSAIKSINIYGLDMARIMYAVTLVNSGLKIHTVLELLDAKPELAKF